MKAFVINLKERPDRLEDFQKIELPFKVEVIEAVKDVDGSLGCIKSHFDVFKKFTSGVNVVFEDDCLQINSIDILHKAIDELDNNWDMLYLGAMVHGEIKTNTEHTDLTSDAWTTHAIAYNGKAISDYILTFNPLDVRRSRRNIDTFIVHAIQKSGRFKCYVTNPQIFIQKLNYSDVINDLRDYNWKYGKRI